jgi:D-psicose/D-tagatose/L-ribulose 3-epimerase
MKIGINTLLWTAAFDEEHLSLLPQLSEWGFDGVEIARFSFDGFPAAKIRAALESEGLACTFCSALTGETSLISADASVRKVALEFLKQGIRTTAELGAKVFVGPFCSPVGKLTGQRATEDEWKYAVEGFRALGEELDACDVLLAHEALNRFETYFGNLSGEAFRLCEEAGHPRLGIVLDTFHANIEEKDTATTVKAVSSRLHHVHSCESDRGIPGTGQVHWDTVLPALVEEGYDGWLVIESFGSRIPEIAAAACLWRDVAPSAESIAVEGLHFLRTGLKQLTR